MSHKPTAGSLSVRERGGADRNVTLYAVVFIINQFKLDLNGRQSARTHCIYCNLHYFPPPIFPLFIINDRSMSDINAWHVCKYICIIFSLGVWYIERGCSCDVHEILYASMQLWCVCVCGLHKALFGDRPSHRNLLSKGRTRRLQLCSDRQKHVICRCSS